jgi:hypothetical protein
MCTFKAFLFWALLQFATYRSLRYHSFRCRLSKLKCLPSSSSSSQATVFNDVLDHHQCRQISKFFYDFVADESLNNGVSSDQCQSASISFRIFNRNDIVTNNNVSSIGFPYIEKLLSSILCELDDESRFVEYWWRGHWNSHVLHRDIDELLLINENVERFPRNAHVLYLNFDEELSLQNGGHTVVLEDSSMHRQLYVVPPRPGRLLRFQGHLLHGVPRPAFEFYLRDQEPEWIQHATSSLGLEALLNDSKTKVERSVLLFNTWGDEPPVSVQNFSQQLGKLAYGVKADLSPICQPFHKWQTAPFISPKRKILQNNDAIASIKEEESIQEDEVATLRFTLPTDRRRRDRYE